MTAQLCVASRSTCRIKSYYVKSCFSPDGSHILSGSSDSNAYIFQVPFRHAHPFSSIYMPMYHTSLPVCLSIYLFIYLSIHLSSSATKGSSTPITLLSASFPKRCRQASLDRRAWP
jgi:WD40 repeat protein